MKEFIVKYDGNETRTIKANEKEAKILNHKGDVILIISDTGSGIKIDDNGRITDLEWYEIGALFEVLRIWETFECQMLEKHKIFKEID